MRIVRVFGRRKKSEMNFYSDEELESLLDEDEITAEEAGFMKGWEEAGF